MILACAVSCEKGGTVRNSDDEGGSEAARELSGLFGFLVQDTEDIKRYEAMHSFIQTCADIGVNAKLYRFSDTAALSEKTDAIIADKCDAVLILAGDIDLTDSIKRLSDNGINTVSLVREDDSCDCSIVLADTDCEMIKVLTEYAEDGTILIYSSSENDLSAMKKQLKDDGYSVKLDEFIRTEYSYKKASESLSAYLTEHTDVRAVYVKGEKNTRPAFMAVKPLGNVRIIGSEISDVNKEYVGHGMYALSVSPYYDMAARAVYAMRTLTVSGEAENEYCNCHLVTEDRLSKYVSLSEKARALFEG